MRAVLLTLLPLAAFAQWQTPTPREKALDEAAFQGIAQTIAERFPDVQSVFVALHGRVAFQYHRDGAPETLREGKKRQIRRMCEMVGLKVLGLKRVRIGRVKLGELPPGQWRYLGADERF